jgi:SAM-dependent methyltransferase
VIAVEELKRTHRATWAAGDYSAVAERIDEVPPRDLLERIEIRPEEDVLDVATGTGNAALRAAAAGAHVVGLDLTPELFERARSRQAEYGVEVEWVEGDAEALPFADGSFDVVLSTFGVMFAPNQEQAASELLRVCRPGGTIGLANWTAEGWLGDVFRTNGKHVPPPAGVSSPLSWGNEARLRDLFGDGIAELRTTRRDFIFRYRSPEHWLSFWREFYGPTVATFAALDADGQRALANDLLEVAHRANVANDGTMAVPAEYLEVVAIRA